MRALPLILIFLVACTEPRRVDPAPQSYDSAGVMVRVLARGADLPTPERPVVEIGRLDQGAAFQLGRVNDAVLASDGGVVVAHDNEEVRHYSRTGEFLWSFGRQGDGPSEFRIISDLAIMGGDSIAVFDPRLRKLIILAPDGMMTRVVGFAAHQLRGALRFGGWLEGGKWLLRLGAAPEMAEGLVEPTELLIVGSPAGESLDTIAEVAGADIFVYARPSGGGLGFGPPPLGRTPQYVADRNHVVVLDGESLSVTRMGLTGERDQVVRFVGSPQVVDRELSDRIVAKRLPQHRDGSRRRAAITLLRSMIVHETAPTFSDVIVEPSGLWVRRWSLDAAEEWEYVQNATNSSRALLLPEGVQLMDARSDRLLLAKRGAMGETVLQVLSIGEQVSPSNSTPGAAR